MTVVYIFELLFYIFAIGLLWVWSIRDSKDWETSIKGGLVVLFVVVSLYVSHVIDIVSGYSLDFRQSIHPEVLETLEERWAAEEKDEDSENITTKELYTFTDHADEVVEKCRDDVKSKYGDESDNYKCYVKLVAVPVETKTQTRKYVIRDGEKVYIEEETNADTDKDRP